MPQTPEPQLVARCREGDESAFRELVDRHASLVYALIARTGIPAPLLQAQLLELELAGTVARLPGGLFQRLGKA